ncbi:Hpt domain-containing protein [Alteromonas pelagimontana]|uniref:Hpt domain-containing protein n=1 Tax=Alteromonas pelagimontana TaxID=1858656 RepID=A0A6M4M9U7_9ALTE|nr:Hpt domain-containing protein [Alteromonas pelagimontana]QJR79922.1 Hpt domain-containing protein [Alteromonas pelagimontana]
MQAPETLVDLDFGLSQLGGNKSLLLTLLQKFAREYEQTPAKLEACFTQQDWQQARRYIHTLKGVSGNMGCTSLHNCCLELENALENNSVSAPYNNFLAVLQQTFTVINKLSADIPAAAPPPEKVAFDPDARIALMEALKRGQFVSQQQLTDWLAASINDSDKRQAVKDAVNEFDYQTAIALLQE